MLRSPLSCLSSHLITCLFKLCVSMCSLPVVMCSVPAFICLSAWFDPFLCTPTIEFWNFPVSDFHPLFMTLVLIYNIDFWNSLFVPLLNLISVNEPWTLTATILWISPAVPVCCVIGPRPGLFTTIWITSDIVVCWKLTPLIV